MRSSWWAFVQQHQDTIDCTQDRKGKFAILSQMWKDKKSELVLINGQYILELNNKIHQLTTRCQDLEAQNKRLQELNDYLTDFNKYHQHDEQDT